MTATTVWTAIGAVAVLGFALKAVGPALFGGRELPPRTRSALALLAPALLAGFVVVEVAGPGWCDVDATVLGGLAAAVGLRAYRAPLPLALIGAVLTTALLRQVTG
ncbi:AzlD domain-containing protein [Streptomyces sp. NPDC048696]|uniref:AzlD domain-containing protein n=1 Tax=Streptomyces sp. NPDC048696 TaxID=3365585 RepID=UPI0037166E3F